MSHNNSNFNITNEQLLLINILNTMYNDNLRQINNLTNSNNEIRNLITRLLNNPNRVRTNYNHNRWRNNYRNTNSNTYTNNLNNQNDYNSTLIFDYIIPRDNTDNDSFSRIFQRFFEPVEVYPTTSQIETATRTVMYSDILTPRNRSCPISLENFNDSDTVSVIRFCGHVFNTEQLNRWFRSNCRCPVCRYDIRNFNQNNVLENIQTTNNDETISETQNNSPPVNTERNNTNPERINTNLNSIYYTLLASGTENLLNLILDPSGNNTDIPTNNILNLLNNQRR